MNLRAGRRVRTSEKTISSRKSYSFMGNVTQSRNSCNTIAQHIDAELPSFVYLTFVQCKCPITGHVFFGHSAASQRDNSKHAVLNLPNVLIHTFCFLG
jgi:hypothetical protein